MHIPRRFTVAGQDAASSPSTPRSSRGLASHRRAERGSRVALVEVENLEPLGRLSSRDDAPRPRSTDLVGDHGTYPSTARACLQRPHSWAAKPLNDSHWFGYEYDVELLMIATQVASSIRS